MANTDISVPQLQRWTLWPTLAQCKWQWPFSFIVYFVHYY